MSDTSPAPRVGQPDDRAEAAVLVAGGANRFIRKQPANESLARVFLGSAVLNASGETIGDVHDLMFDASGRITSVLLGVGGFVGLGEKIVAMPFNAITIAVTENAVRTLTVHADKRKLQEAPDFAATEKTTLDSVTDLAAVLGHKAAVKAVQIKDQAIKAVEGLRK